MNRVEATSIVLAEAFAENGLVMLAHQGEDPGFQRMGTLISAIKFLADDVRLKMLPLSTIHRLAHRRYRVS